jgi:thiol-disulfide isomerase/thioredoxin
MLRVMAALVVALMASAADAKPQLASLQGDVTVLAFWATSCAPCRKELPRLEALRKSLAADAKVRVVAVSIDLPGDEERARKMARELGLKGTLVVDQDVYEEVFGYTDEASVPRLAVIDRKRAGLERVGMRAGEDAEAFVREVTAAVASVKAAAADKARAVEPPTPMWRPLAPAHQ